MNSDLKQALLELEMTRREKADLEKREQIIKNNIFGLLMDDDLKEAELEGIHVEMVTGVTQNRFSSALFKEYCESEGIDESQFKTEIQIKDGLRVKLK